MDIIENNKLIAEFMGLSSQLHMTEHHETGVYINSDDLEYNSSYDWLLPVVEKITDIKRDQINPLISFTINVNPKSVILRSNVVNGLEPLELYGGMLIDSIYIACIHFITWHNENAK